MRRTPWWPLSGRSSVRRGGRAPVALCLLVVALLLGGTPAHAETLAEYTALVARAAALLAAVPEDDGAAEASALAEVERQLGAVESVQLPGGTTVRLANPPLRAALASGDSAAVGAQLAALQDALERAQTTRPAPADASDRLAAILARPEFRTEEPPPWNRLLQPLRDQWERLWRNLAHWLASSGEGGIDLIWALPALLVVLGVVAVLVGAFGGNVVASARVAASAPGHRAAARETRARAEALAAAGDYRAAVHELYLATLQHLDERGLLWFRHALTNREHLRHGRVAPALLASLTTLVEGYDRAWYSGEVCTADDWRRFRALADAVAAGGHDDRRPAGVG
jgi:hypothetical protein